jgi:hypothetical protein
MKALIYNIEIFKVWFKFILLRIPLSQEAYDMIKNHYTMTSREEAMMKRVAKINNLKP